MENILSAHNEMDADFSPALYDQTVSASNSTPAVQPAPARSSGTNIATFSSLAHQSYVLNFCIWFRFVCKFDDLGFLLFLVLRTPILMIEAKPFMSVVLNMEGADNKYAFLLDNYFQLQRALLFLIFSFNFSEF